MACGSGGGEDDSGVGRAFEEGGDEFEGDTDFADADGVEPEALIVVGDGGEGGALGGVEEADALAEVGPVAAALPKLAQGARQHG
jgi:hypothetical protein